MFEISARRKGFNQLRFFHFGCGIRATAIFPNRSYEHAETPRPRASVASAASVLSGLAFDFVFLSVSVALW